MTWLLLVAAGLAVALATLARPRRARGLVDMGVPPPHPTTTSPDAPYEDYDG